MSLTTLQRAQRTAAFRSLSASRSCDLAACAKKKTVTGHRGEWDSYQFFNANLIIYGILHNVYVYIYIYVYIMYIYIYTYIYMCHPIPSIPSFHY